MGSVVSFSPADVKNYPEAPLYEALVLRTFFLEFENPDWEKELAEFGFGETVSGLAYRYDAQPYGATLSIERRVPRVTARTFSFLRIEPEGMTAHYEVHYHAEQARVGQHADSRNRIEVDELRFHHRLDDAAGSTPSE
jgi:hypothetical protein